MKKLENQEEEEEEGKGKGEKLTPSSFTVRGMLRGEESSGKTSFTCCVAISGC